MKTRMSKNLGWVVSAFAFLLFTGCASTAHVEKAKDADLGRYKTFAWIDKDTANKLGHSNDLAEQNLKASVNQELEKKGFREVETNPDLLLTYDILVEKNTRHESNAVYSQPYSRLFYNPYSGRYRTIYFPSQLMGYDHYETPVKEGTVTITMIDAKTDKTVWQGWSTNELNSSRITSKDVQKNVKSIFKKFDVASR